MGMKGVCWWNAFFGWYVFSSRVLLLFLLWLMDGGVVQTKPSPLHRSSKISAALPKRHYLLPFYNLQKCGSLPQCCVGVWSQSVILGNSSKVWFFNDWSLLYLFALQTGFFWDFNLGGPLYLLMAGLNYWFVFVMIGHDVLKIQHVSFFF